MSVDKHNQPTWCPRHKFVVGRAPFISSQVGRVSTALSLPSLKSFHGHTSPAWAPTPKGRRRETLGELGFQPSFFQEWKQSWLKREGGILVQMPRRHCHLQTSWQQGLWERTYISFIWRLRSVVGPPYMVQLLAPLFQLSLGYSEKRQSERGV